MIRFFLSHIFLVYSIYKNVNYLIGNSSLVEIKMSRRQCFSVTLVILIYACFVSSADFQNDFDSSKVIKFIENVQQRNLLSNFRREGQRKFSSPCYGDIYEFIMSLLKKEIWTLKSTYNL